MELSFFNIGLDQIYIFENMDGDYIIEMYPFDDDGKVVFSYDELKKFATALLAELEKEN